MISSGSDDGGGITGTSRWVMASSAREAGASRWVRASGAVTGLSRFVGASGATGALSRDTIRRVARSDRPSSSTRSVVVATGGAGGSDGGVAARLAGGGGGGADTRGATTAGAGAACTTPVLRRSSMSSVSSSSSASTADGGIGGGGMEGGVVGGASCGGGGAGEGMATGRAGTGDRRRVRSPEAPRAGTTGGPRGRRTGPPAGARGAAPRGARGAMGPTRAAGARAPGRGGWVALGSNTMSRSPTAAPAVAGRRAGSGSMQRRSHASKASGSATLWARARSEGFGRAARSGIFAKSDAAVLPSQYGAPTSSSYTMRASA
jgi:hypothetical protein